MIQEKWKTDSVGWGDVSGGLGVLYTKPWIPRVDRGSQSWCMKKRPKVERLLGKTFFLT